MSHRLDEFEDLIVEGELTNAQIAKIADVSEDEVAAYRASGGAPPAGPDAPAAAPATSAAPRAAVAPPPVAEAPESVPACVRVLRRALVRGLDGRMRRLALRDVYRGEEAAWLWRAHRRLVEPFPPAKG